MQLSTPRSCPEVRVSRRRLLVGGALGFAAALLPGAAVSLAREPSRRLALYNIHTGESGSLIYWADGDYLPDSLRAIDQLLRDHRSGEVEPIDPRLLDRLHRVAAALAARSAYHVVSGFRSESTNEMLRARSGGVARRSLHRLGMAVDVYLPGSGVESLRRAALAEGRGGVGGYPDFVHLDVGRPRDW